MTWWTRREEDVDHCRFEEFARSCKSALHELCVCAGGAYERDPDASRLAHASKIGCYFCHCYGHTGTDHGIHYDAKANKRWLAGQRQWRIISMKSIDFDGNPVAWTAIAGDEGISLEGVATEGIPQRRGIAILVAHSLVAKGISLWHPLEAVGKGGS